MTRTKHIGDLEQRYVAIEREFRRAQEAAESCGLAIQNHVEEDRDEIQAARVSLTEEQETMRKVVVSDLIRLAKEKVKTIEDSGMYRWMKTHLDTGITHSASVMESESANSERIEGIVALAAGTTYNQVVAMRSSDSCELQLSVWGRSLIPRFRGFVLARTALVDLGVPGKLHLAVGVLFDGRAPRFGTTP